VKFFATGSCWQFIKSRPDFLSLLALRPDTIEINLYEGFMGICEFRILGFLILSLVKPIPVPHEVWFRKAGIREVPAFFDLHGGSHKWENGKPV